MDELQDEVKTLFERLRSEQQEHKNSPHVTNIPTFRGRVLDMNDQAMVEQYIRRSDDEKEIIAALEEPKVVVDEFGEVPAGTEIQGEGPVDEFALIKQGDCMSLKYRLGRKWTGIAGYDGAEFRDIKPMLEFFMMDYVKGKDRVQMELFLNKLRENFMETHAMYLNHMVRPRRYARFKNVTPATVERWIKAGECDVVVIDDVRFILVDPKDIFAFGKFMMEEALTEDVWDSDTEIERRRILKVYEASYGKTDIKAEDTVLSWVRYKGLHPKKDPNDGNDKKIKYDIAKAYGDYCEWASHRKKKFVGLNAFSMRIDSFGFQKYNNKRRGFHWYKNEFINNNGKEA